jgi:hypothetical protein
VRTAVLVGEAAFTLALLGVAIGATAARSSIDQRAPGQRTPDPWPFWQVAGFSGAGVGVVAIGGTYWFWPTRTPKRGLRVGPDLGSRGMILAVSGVL